MSPNMDLIRLVVLKACTDDPNGVIDGYGDDEIKYHRKLAIEKGLLTGFVMDSLVFFAQPFDQQGLYSQDEGNLGKIVWLLQIGLHHFQYYFSFTCCLFADAS